MPIVMSEYAACSQCPMHLNIAYILAVAASRVALTRGRRPPHIPFHCDSFEGI